MGRNSVVLVHSSPCLASELAGHIAVTVSSLGAGCQRCGPGWPPPCSPPCPLRGSGAGGPAWAGVGQARKGSSDTQTAHLPFPARNGRFTTRLLVLVLSELGGTPMGHLPASELHSEQLSKSKPHPGIPQFFFSREQSQPIPPGSIGQWSHSAS